MDDVPRIPIAGTISKGPKKYSTMTIDDKLELIRIVDRKEKRKIDIAKDFNIPVSTLSTILKMRKNLENFAAERHPRGMKRFRIRNGKHKNLEAELFDWYREAIANNTRITYQRIRERASELAVDMNIDFKFSNGWLYRFLARHEVTVTTPMKKNKRIPEDPDKFVYDVSTFSTIIEQYPPDNIFAMEEVFLYYTTNTSESCKPFDNRMAVVFCCNATGTEKLPPLIVANKEHMVFYNRPQLNCNYATNETASITPQLFIEWMSQLEFRMRNENRHILLVLDQSSAHDLGNTNLQNVQILYSPPGLKSYELRPFFGGIARRIKHRYRKRIGRHYQNNPSESSPSWCVYDAAKIACIVWDTLKDHFLRSCFAKTDLLPEEERENGEDCDDESDMSLDDVTGDYPDIEPEQVMMKRERYSDHDDSNQADGVFTEEFPIFAKRDRIKAKQNGADDAAEEMVEDKSEEIKDGHTVYSESVASRIRNLNDDYLTAIARNKIDQALFEVEMMKFQKNNDVNKCD